MVNFGMGTGRTAHEALAASHSVSWDTKVTKGMVAGEDEPRKKDRENVPRSST
jgi:hypothetical protein